jgi:N,N-dimethylformamidase
LLASYRVVLTGSHPEYWTGAMLDARDSYLNSGGRLMYLGGNGFYWVTAVDSADDTLIEVRRFAGTRTWQAEPGEYQISLTGEMGGLWRDRGRAPQKTVGVAFSGMGFDRGAPYRRLPASRDPDVAFIFEGVDSDVFGDGPALVLNHGAAGFEVDRASAAQGTPAHARILATAFGLTDAYQLAVEELISTSPWTGGSVSRLLGADMVYLAYPEGGGVFSVGSITWTSTLSFNGYDGDTSRITENVLRAFLRPRIG